MKVEGHSADHTIRSVVDRHINVFGDGPSFIDSKPKLYILLFTI